MGIKASLKVWGVLLAGGLALALPLFILIFQTPISAATLQEFAEIHTTAHFSIRAILTYIYFPAVLIVHYLAIPTNGVSRQIYTFGFALFIAGNAIDLVYRAIQYQVVHLSWAVDYLAAATEDEKSLAATKIAVFSEIAPAVTLSFSLLFAIARLAMGSALMRSTRPLVRIAAIALIANGLWNIVPRIASFLDMDSIASLSSLYLFPWLLSIAGVTYVAVIRVQSR